MVGKYQTYPEYKESGVEWLGEIPSHWKLTRVKHIAELTPRKPDISRNLMCSFVPMEKLKTNSIVLDETRLIDDVYDGYVYFRDDDILMAKVTPCFENKNIAVAAGLTNKIGFGSSEIYVLRVNQNASGRYLYYRLQEDAFMDIATAAMTGAGGLKRVPSDIVNNFSLSFPAFEEQQKIANFLDHETAKIDTLIEKQQQLIKLLKEKRQAVISHAVTKGLNPNAPMRDSGVEWLGEVPEHWEVKKLKYVGEARNGLTYSPNNITDTENGTLVLRSSNVQNKKITFDDNVYVNMAIPERMITKVNDILICSRNGSRALIGKNAIIDEHSSGNAFGAFMMIYRSDLNPYLFHVFNSSLFEYQSGTFLTSTINQLTVGNMDGFEVPIPPKDEREEIINYLARRTNDFDLLIKKNQIAIKLIQERRTALISAAVTGKIDVRGWQVSEKNSFSIEAS